MHLAIPYNDNYPQYIHEDTEFNLHFRQLSRPADIINFTKVNPNRRLNVEFDHADDIDIAIVQEMMKYNKNVYLRMQPEVSIYQAKEWIEQGINCFYNYNAGAYSLVLLDTLLSIGVSDVYLMDDLNYNLARVSEHCREAGVQVRAVLNRIPSTSPLKGYDFREVIYTPQNMFFYKRYIDAVEFDCGIPYSFERLRVYERVFFQDEKWDGDLSDLNLDLKINIPNRSLFSAFINQKTICRRECSVQAPRKCHKCDQFIRMAQNFWLDGLTVADENEKEGVINLEDTELGQFLNS